MACITIKGLTPAQEKELRKITDTIPAVNAPKSDYSIEFAVPITLDRQNSLWFGGDVVCISYLGYKFSVEASGDVRTTIYDKVEKRDVVNVRDDGNKGDLANKMLRFIKNDEELSEALSGVHERYELCLQDGNWFEVFVCDKTGEWLADSWVVSNGIFTAVIEALEGMDDFIANLQLK